jgi:hypothetical protein
MGIFDRAELERAVRLSQRGYALVRWLQRVLAPGTVSFDVVHRDPPIEDAAREWVRRNQAALPREARPEPDELDGLASLFASYLLVSFDHFDDPGERRAPSPLGCCCPLCARIVALPHLQPKRLEEIDKWRARRLELAFLRDLAGSLGVAAPDTALERLAERSELREPLAMATYARDLLGRIAGRFEGPETLALWRRFAWTASGSPKKGFSLTADAILAAEAELVAALHELG